MAFHSPLRSQTFPVNGTLLLRTTPRRCLIFLLPRNLPHPFYCHHPSLKFRNSDAHSSARTILFFPFGQPGFHDFVFQNLVTETPRKCPGFLHRTGKVTFCNFTPKLTIELTCPPERGLACAIMSEASAQARHRGGGSG